MAEEHPDDCTCWRCRIEQPGKCNRPGKCSCQDCILIKVVDHLFSQGRSVGEMNFVRERMETEEQRDEWHELQERYLGPPESARGFMAGE